MFIYKLTNKTNGKSYIGATIQGVHRWMVEHRYQAKSGAKFAISKAIREFGIEAFELTVLKEAQSVDELMQFEIDAIREFDTMEPNGYNNTKGGRGTLGHTVPESARQVASRVTKGRVLPAYHREAIRKAMIGNQHAAGKTYPDRQGTPHTPETKVRMSLAKAGGKNWNARSVDVGGRVYPSSTEAGQELGLTRDGIRSLIRRGLAKYITPSKYPMVAAREVMINPRSCPIELNGINYPSVAEAARKSGLTYGQVWHRVRTGRARYLNPPSGGASSKDKLTP